VPGPDTKAACINALRQFGENFLPHTEFHFGVSRAQRGQSRKVDQIVLFRQELQSLCAGGLGQWVMLSVEVLDQVAGDVDQPNDGMIFFTLGFIH